MIYRYGYLRREALALLCCGVAVCLVTATGCVDHRYDLKGDLDLSVGVGGKELTIPVGETEKITLEKMTLRLCRTAPMRCSNVTTCRWM